ncbi:MAG: transporter substrate-binding domain-containing protein [Halioglobus sp.]
MQPSSRASFFNLLGTLLLAPLLCVCVSGVQAQQASSSVPLSQAEKAWLQQHSVIRLAPDPGFAPVEWFNRQGDYHGITFDYVQLLEQRLGVRFEIVRGKDWSDILATAKAGEVDALSAIMRTGAREQHLVFTKPYLTLTRGVLAARELDPITRVEDLRGYKVAVVEGSWMDEKLDEYTGMSINHFQDLATALAATSLGVTDVTASALETMAFTRRDEGLTNLQKVGELDHEVALSFAVSKSVTPLAGILEKGLASITSAEAAEIRARWIETSEQPFWQKPVYRYSAIALLVLLLACMAVVIAWNRMLNTRVQERSRQLEEAHIQLIQAEKMESVGRLSAGVAHEVKNPLAIIQMGADYLMEVVPDEDGAKEVVADIGDAVRRADTVIKGLLDFSHSDKLALSSGNLNELIEEAQRLVGHEFRQRNIALNTHLSPSNPQIQMDANKIKQVLINMLMNAAQAVGGDGEVNVSCEVVSIDANSSNNAFQVGEPALRLRIVDNGPGISEENLVKLFDPFFTTKPVGEGTGLGLSVSRNIMELHSGVLDIGNAPEGGARVTMDFRIEKEDQA